MAVTGITVEQRSHLVHTPPAASGVDAGMDDTTDTTGSADTTVYTIYFGVVFGVLGLYLLIALIKSTLYEEVAINQP